MTKLSLAFIPLLFANLNLSCSQGDDLPKPIPSNAEVRVSVSLSGDLDGIAGLSIRLTPADYCEGYWDSNEGIEPYSTVIDASELIMPDGSPALAGPNEYAYVLAETTFTGTVAGCYDLIATPLADTENEIPALTCVGPQYTVEIEDGDSLVFDPFVPCGELPRTEMDVLDGNFAPFIESLTVSPEVSSCDVTTICATARDADYDMLEFEWPQPPGLEQKLTSAPWPTLVSHRINADDSVTQCIAAQAHEPGTYDISVNVYDVTRETSTAPPIRIEDLTGQDSHASETAALNATLGCEATGRSAVIVMTLDNDPGMSEDQATQLIDNAVRWAAEDVLGAQPSFLVVLDDNHHGEDWQDGEFVHAQLTALGFDADYMVEPSGGLAPTDLEAYDLVWFVNPGYEMDDAATHTALLRYRQQGGALIMQGDDIARFRANPQFMEPLTYLSWFGNGTIACGAHIDNNSGESYHVQLDDSASAHPMTAGLEDLSFEYGNDIDLTRPLDAGEQVLAWASYSTSDCVVKTPAIVALDPELLQPW